MEEFIRGLINENDRWQKKINNRKIWVKEGKNIESNKKDIKIYNSIIDENNKSLKLAYKLIDLAEKENLIISKSPFSDSFYAHSEKEKINWGYKPEGSYRFSDHWSFSKNGDIHCEVDRETLDLMCLEDDFVAICKMVNGLYRKVN